MLLIISIEHKTIIQIIPHKEHFKIKYSKLCFLHILAIYDFVNFFDLRPSDRTVLIVGKKF